MKISARKTATRNKSGWVHIKLEHGVWCAHGHGPKWARNLLLVPAINFCKKLNSKHVKENQ